MKILCLLFHDWWHIAGTRKEIPHPNPIRAAHGHTVTTYLYFCERCGVEKRREEMW